MLVLDRWPVAVWALGYLALTLGVGVWTVRHTRTPKDFFIAGQSVGLVATALTTMSAAFSGFVFLGGPGLMYGTGIGSLFIVLPIGITGTLLCAVQGRRLRRLAGQQEIYTVPDVVASMFPGRGPAGLAALAVAAGTVAYLGLQIQAMGLVLQTVLGWRSLGLAMALGLVVVVVYSAVGGMLAGVRTDVLQGALMLVVALLVFARVLQTTGGWLPMLEVLGSSAAHGRSFLEPLGRLPARTAFGFFLVFGVGVLGQPHLVHKFFMVRDERSLRFMPLMLGLGQGLCLLVWLGVGLAVPALVASGRLGPLDRPDDAMLSFLVAFAPDALLGLALAGVLAAIMSTADSFLNIGAAAVVRDFPRALGLPVKDELRGARLAVLAVAAAAAVFAYLYGDLIAILGTFAFGTFAAALAPVLTVGLCWRRVRGPAVSASIATGLLLNVGLELASRAGWTILGRGVLPSAVALTGAFVALFVVTWVTSATGVTSAPGSLGAKPQSTTAPVPRI